MKPQRQAERRRGEHSGADQDGEADDDAGAARAERLAQRFFRPEAAVEEGEGDLRRRGDECRDMALREGRQDAAAAGTGAGRSFSEGAAQSFLFPRPAGLASQA